MRSGCDLCMDSGASGPASLISASAADILSWSKQTLGLASLAPASVAASRLCLCGECVVQIVEVGMRLSRWKGLIVCVEGGAEKAAMKEEVPSYDPASPRYVCGHEEVVESDDVSTSDTRFEMALNGEEESAAQPATMAETLVDDGDTAVPAPIPETTLVPYLPETVSAPNSRRRRGDGAKKNARKTKNLGESIEANNASPSKGLDTKLTKLEQASSKNNEVKATDETKTESDATREVTSTRGKLTCSDCGKTFGRESSLQAHATIHTGKQGDGLFR